MGNHEEDFLRGSYSGSSELVKLFFDSTFPSFERNGRIEKFLSTYTYKNFVFSHTIDGKRVYPDTEITLDNNYFIGHSHHQFKYENSDFVLYNTGSVGQNRSEINICNYLVFDADTYMVRMGAVDFDIQATLSEMRKLNYPIDCIEYYTNKMRKN